MGLKVLWIVFGAAVFYAIAAVLVPVLILILRGRSVDISDEAATSLSRFAALLASALGGALGLRHAQKLQRSR